MTVYNLMRQDWTGKMGNGPTSQNKHSTIFIGDDIIGEELNCCRGKARHGISIDGEVDTSWGESPLIRNMAEVAICKPTQSALSWARFSSHDFCLCFFLLFFLKSLTFAWTTLLGFQSTGNIFFFVP